MTMPQRCIISTVHMVEKCIQITIINHIMDKFSVVMLLLIVVHSVLFSQHFIGFKKYLVMGNVN